MLPPTISIIEQIVAAHGCEKLPASYDSAVAHQSNRRGKTTAFNVIWS